MVTSWGWIGPYLIVIALAVVVGPVLATLPLFAQTFVPPLKMHVADAVRLAADGLCLLMILLAALRARRELRDNGKGQTFARALLLPTAGFLMVLVASRAYDIHGIPVLGPPRQPLYNWLLITGLLGSASWLTFAWVRHTDALMRACAGSTARPASARESERTPAPTAAARRSDSRPATAVPPAGAPTMLGRYRIVKELGRGSMGVVYLGKDPTIQRAVAIKTMRLEDIADAEDMKTFRDRFFREAESTGRLSHPNIVTVYDAGEQDGLAYIAMEYLEGTLLSASCHKTTLLPAKQALDITADVADALDYAHGQGVVHRDIKPANIMVLKQRLVKVMDFGIAKLATGSTTQTRMILGTPRYMSPEQAVGKDVDGRSDIFSLGVVLFELLAGERPFEAEHMAALVVRIVQSPHAPMLKYRQDLPPRLQTVLDRALHKDIACRYRHAGHMAQDLRELVRILSR